MRIRSCHGTSRVRLTAGTPLGGVNAGGGCCALYVLGGLNADPSASTGCCGATSSPSGTANSEVVSDSVEVLETASPSGSANSDVVDASPSAAAAATPAGGMNALLASSDCGLRSSASVTLPFAPCHDTVRRTVSPACPSHCLSMRTHNKTGRTCACGPFCVSQRGRAQWPPDSLKRL